MVTTLLQFVCMALTGYAVGNAFNEEQHIYPTVVHLTKSNISMFALYAHFVLICCAFGLRLRRLFLGTMLAGERDHIAKQFWFAFTESCIAFAVFHHEFSPCFVTMFTLMLFLKCFHWLIEIRVRLLERQAVQQLLMHLRLVCLFVVLSSVDIVLLRHAYKATIIELHTVQLVFAFEYTMALTLLATSGVRYVFYLLELHGNGPNNCRRMYALYIDLTLNLFKLILHIVFIVLMTKAHAFRVFIFRSLLITMNDIKTTVIDLSKTRRSKLLLSSLVHEDATDADLLRADNLCSICREEMRGQSKKLPCGHVFHTICLHAWLHHKQTCPMCRYDILRIRGQVPIAILSDDLAATADGLANIETPANSYDDPDAPSSDSQNRHVELHEYEEEDQDQEHEQEHEHYEELYQALDQDLDHELDQDLYEEQDHQQEHYQADVAALEQSYEQSRSITTEELDALYRNISSNLDIRLRLLDTAQVVVEDEDDFGEDEHSSTSRVARQRVQLLRNIQQLLDESASLMDNFYSLMAAAERNNPPITRRTGAYHRLSNSPAVYYNAPDSARI